MIRSAVLTIDQRHCRGGAADGRPTSWVWELWRPETFRAEFVPVRLSCVDLAELDRLHALPQRIAALRGKRDGLTRIEDEVRSAGEWIARVGLGRMTGHLKALGPAVVRLELPPQLAGFEALPWELALVDGRPLARYGMTVVRGARSLSEAVRGRPDLPPRLRMLALFSLPRAAATLDLGAHRTALRGKLLALAADGRAGAVPLELRTRQFGVGRATLRGMLDEADGWDIVHVVAHGLPGILRLELPDGTEDPVPTRDLVELLGGLRNRVRLVFLSACWSGGQAPGGPDGAGEESETEAHMGREEGGGDVFDGAGAAHSALTSLASAMADELGCAVIAMRFPVGNDFALAFAVRLYTHLLRHRHVLPQALHNALVDTVADPELGESRYPLFSAATPMLYGAAALDRGLLDRPMPRGHLPGRYTGNAGPLPDRPASFVGRLREMIGANTALAPASGVPGAVIHGDRGMGATTCAALLAHDHREAFSTIVWHPRPEWAEAITPSCAEPVTDFMRHLEIRLPELSGLSSDLSWTEAIARIAGLRLLVIVDAADRVHDPRWAEMIDALASAEGPGKLLLTSRTDLPGIAPALRRVPLPPLELAEMRQIIRTLPRLGPIHRIRETSRTADQVVRRAAGNPGALHEAEASAGTQEELNAWLRGRSA
ncbi:CHAT domain-containing protein [Streptomyces sp. IB201691-2A2]|uniref:CHAT domain-containing protein n=1 Tax=Streptomyces sp. IB201691-2A2 TaxID=2561920 RepID=UPI001180088D|nr:CHAT domain-containing protein [Streptomyces sp. IB201691-2A2]TRO58558.1 CHAT domain-containing protein [Streptomyces sp. IB201691-2A2]